MGAYSLHIHRSGAYVCRAPPNSTRRWRSPGGGRSIRGRALHLFVLHFTRLASPPVSIPPYFFSTARARGHKHLRFRFTGRRAIFTCTEGQDARGCRSTLFVYFRACVCVCEKRERARKRGTEKNCWGGPRAAAPNSNALESSRAYTPTRALLIERERGWTCIRVRYLDYYRGERARERWWSKNSLNKRFHGWREQRHQPLFFVDRRGAAKALTSSLSPHSASCSTRAHVYTHWRPQTDETLYLKIGARSPGNYTYKERATLPNTRGCSPRVYSVCYIEFIKIQCRAYTYTHIHSGMQRREQPHVTDRYARAAELHTAIWRLARMSPCTHT